MLFRSNSTYEMAYRMYFGAYENCSKCIDSKSWYKQDDEIINLESELLNLKRPLSKCDKYKYDPNCSSADCVNTFDQRLPKILSPSLCPIVHQNIKKTTNNGVNTEFKDVCGARTGSTWTVVNDSNTSNKYINEHYSNIANNCSTDNVYSNMTNDIKPFEQNNSFASWK